MARRTDVRPEIYNYIYLANILAIGHTRKLALLVIIIFRGHDYVLKSLSPYKGLYYYIECTICGRI